MYPIGSKALEYSDCNIMWRFSLVGGAMPPSSPVGGGGGGGECPPLESSLYNTMSHTCAGPVLRWKSPANTNAQTHYVQSWVPATVAGKHSGHYELLMKMDEHLAEENTDRHMIGVLHFVGTKFSYSTTLNYLAIFLRWWSRGVTVQLNGLESKKALGAWRWEVWGWSSWRLRLM
jgi:hypothetical protein